MDLSSVGDIIHRGGTILKTARCEEFTTEEGRAKAITVLNVFGVDGVVVIGGDGSFKGAQKLSDMGFPAIGIPGTIDNDLAYTDYTIGFDTALNTVIDAVSKLRDTSSSHERVSILEVMGRHCGDIALYSGLAGGAEIIIIPEVEFNEDEICKKLIQSKNRGKKQSIIMLAEGIGGAAELADKIKNKTGIESRCTILGHIQRGGSPSSFDRIIASQMGARSVELLINGKSSRVVGIKNNGVMDMDINEALAMERKLNKGLYDLAKILSI